MIGTTVEKGTKVEALAMGFLVAALAAAFLLLGTARAGPQSSRGPAS